MKCIKKKRSDLTDSFFGSGVDDRDALLQDRFSPFSVDEKLTSRDRCRHYQIQKSELAGFRVYLVTATYLKFQFLCFSDSQSNGTKSNNVNDLMILYIYISSSLLEFFYQKRKYSCDT